MKAVNAYYQQVLETLQGRTSQLRAIPPERLDWAGPGALLELYRKTSGKDRHGLILAIGQVIENRAVPAHLLAQLIQIASSLDLADIEPQVRALQEKELGAYQPLRGAIANYMAFRKLNTFHKTEIPVQALKAKRNGRKARSGRGTRKKVPG